MKNIFFNFKIIKKVLIALLILITVFLTTFISKNTAFAKCEAYYTASDMANVTFENYNSSNSSFNIESLGEIGIVKGQIHVGSLDLDVYIIVLSGTEFVYDKNDGLQATDIITDIIQGLNYDNSYSKAVVKAIMENVPKGENLLFYGHSLGGMVAQYVISNDLIKKNYNCLYTVTFGSPLISYGKRAGYVSRLCDSHDIIPTLSIHTISDYEAQFHSNERKVEDGGYSYWGFTNAHSSYNRASVWGNYDVLGEKFGNTYLTFDKSEIQRYHAPFFT